MGSNTLLWAVLGVAFALDLLISAAKSAFSHVRLPYLISLREKEPGKVDRTIALIEKVGLRTSLRLGLALAHFLVAGVAAVIVIQILKIPSFWALLGIIIGIMLLVSVFEYLLERRILDAPEKSAIGFTGFAALLDFFFLPATKLMTALLGTHAEKVTLSVTDEALRDWVEVGQPESTLEKGEREMIYSIFHFSETLTREIMVPRIDVLALDVNTTISGARKEFINAGHSRVPVYEDTVDNVVGLLYAKDLLGVVDGNDTIAQQRKLLRPAYFVPEAKKVDELLTELQLRGVHMAVVVDEYGGVAGVVTLEDIMEEIVGEIRDEYDQAEERLYEETGSGEYVFLGRATIDEFNEATGLHLSKEHADTLGGLIYSKLGRVPQPGEVVNEEGVEFTVEEVIARRILKVKARMLTEGRSLEEQEGNNVK
ncbi:MAG: HlyC/CorC family transporter [Chloroflexi bacterium]|nr:HlyC/CorC family transporter [Chloroflexota bacterium]